MKKTPRYLIDSELLHRLKRGDESAFDIVYWAYNPWIYNFIHSLLYDKALTEDLTQNVFLKIWEKRADINPEQPFESYLFTIARHLVYKETANRLLAEQLLSTLIEKDTDINTHEEETLDTQFLHEYINKLVELLPPSRKEIYKLSRHSHLSNKEIAAKLSISEKTVETQLYRALQFLKKKLSFDTGLFLLSFLLVC